MAYVLPTLVAMGFGYAICELALKRPLVGLKWAWAGFWLVVAGTAMAAVTMAHGQGLGAVHVLPADDCQPVLLHRGGAGRGRLVGLGGADVHQPAHLAEGEPGATMPLAMFGNVAGRVPLGLDLGGRCRRSARAHPSRIAWLDRHHQRRPRTRSLLLDASRHRVLLADAGLHRLLHHRAARHRRPPLQRHDGSRGVRALSCLLDADWHPSPLRRPAGGSRLQVRARRHDGDGVGSDAAHRLHHRCVGRDRCPLAWRQGRCSAGSRRCHGTTR